VAADVRWDPAAAPDPGLVDRAWAFVRDHALAAAAAGAGGDGKGARPRRGATHPWLIQGLRVAACTCGRQPCPATGLAAPPMENPVFVWRGRAARAAGEGAAGIVAVALQDAVVASSAAVVRVRAPRVRLRLSRADLAALWHLADALAAWRAAYAPPPPAVLPPPVQAAVLVDAGLSCSLQQARAHPNPSRNPPRVFQRSTAWCHLHAPCGRRPAPLALAIAEFRPGLQDLTGCAETGTALGARCCRRKPIMMPSALASNVKSANDNGEVWSAAGWQERDGPAAADSRPAFVLSAMELRAFAGAGLGGALGASLALVTASDARVAAGEAGACLLHVPPAGAAGPGAPCVELLSVHRCAPLAPARPCPTPVARTCRSIVMLDRNALPAPACPCETVVKSLAGQPCWIAAATPGSC
jgi:hypothetical protein